MRHQRARVLAVVAALFFALRADALAALPGDFWLERVGAHRGLKPEVVTAILRDRTGFLWIGTREGLIRYDGYSVTVYDHDLADPDSISGNAIRTIYEDGDGRLWIGTNTSGLNLMDPPTGRFRAFRHDSADPGSLSHDSVYSILQTTAGDYWVGTQSGLNRFDPSTGRFRRVPSGPGGPSHDYIHSMYEDGEGALWIATVGGGLNRVDPDTGTFTYFRHDRGSPRSLASDNVFAVTEDNESRLWIATENGVCLLDRDAQTFDCLSHDPDDPGSLAYPLVTTLAPGPPGTLFVGTWRGGVNRLDVARGEFTVRRDRDAATMAPEDRTVCLFADRSGVVWAGTWGGGLNRVRPAGPFVTLRRKGADGGPSVWDATSVREGRDGTLWVGTFGNGLSRRAAGRSTFEPVPASTGATVMSIEQTRAGTIWYGTVDGLVRFDPSSGASESLAHEPADPTSLGPGYVTALLEDRRGTLWVGTGEGGLQRLRADGRSFDHYRHDPAVPSSPSDNYVTALFEDAAGVLWVGTRSGGLNACDSAGRCRRYANDPDDPDTIGHDYVTSIHEDRDGRLWVGTGGGGLNRLDPGGPDGPDGSDGSDGPDGPDGPDGEAPRFVHVTEVEGLADDNVMGIVEDDDGSLWLSTRGGVTRYDPETGWVANFGVAEGLPTVEFNSGVFARGEKQMYFGSPAGIVAAAAGTPFPDLRPSATVLTSIGTQAGPLHGERSATELEALQLPYGEVVSFQFSVLDYDEETRHRYAYRLKGLHEAWTHLGPRREITFADLSPGSYVLEFRGRNAQGVWSTPARPLRLKIVPSWWMTAWFRGVALAVLVGLAVAAHRVRVATLERRHRELRVLTRKLEAAKEGERQRIARELHDDMGQVLGAIKINLQLLPQLGDVTERLRRIEDCVVLVDRTIAKVRSMSLDLRPPFLDELGLVPALRGYLEAVSRRSGVAIRVVANGELEGLGVETEVHVFRLVQESVTNVLRHSGSTSATVRVIRAGGRLRVLVRDDGRGFDVDRALDRARSGHHLGLLGMRERLHSIGGDFVVDSAPGRGTEIRIEVPLAS